MSARKPTDSTDKLKGSVKEAIGKLIGDGKVEAEGAAQQKSANRSPKSKTGPGGRD